MTMNDDGGASSSSDGRKKQRMSSSAMLLTAAPIAPLQQQLNGPNLLKQQLIDVLYSNGALRKKTPTDIVNVGLSLIPKLIAREDYDNLKLDCAAFNRDVATLYSTSSLSEFFESYGGGDSLVRILLDILKQSQQLGRADECKPTGVIIRNDFMYDALSERFLQVEFNHIACGLGQLTSRIKNSLQLFHQSYLLHSEATAAAASPPPSQPVFVPTSNSTKQIEMFTELFRLYGNPRAAFVEVMLDNEPNIFDSIPNETMLSQSGISVLRLLFSDIKQQNFRLDDAKKLYVHGREVAVVYFRSMYDPSHFSDSDKTAFWVAAERSTALMLPDVRSFLLGIKLTQHLLSSPALLSRHNLTSLLSSRFASHYCDTKHITTDYDDNVAAFLTYAKANKPNLLLKSLQEDAMIEFIEAQPLSVLKNYLLSYRIHSPVTDSIALIFHEVKHVPATVSELSIYSSIIIKPNQSHPHPQQQQQQPATVLYESMWDYLLRSKPKVFLLFILTVLLPSHKRIFKNEIKGGMNIGISFMDTLAYAN